MKKFRKDISNHKSSVGFHLIKHRDELYSLRSVQAIAAAVKQIFIDCNLNTPKTRLILFKLEHGNMRYSHTLIYLQNLMFASAGMATY